MASAAEYGARGRPAMPCCRSMRTSAADFGSNWRDVIRYCAPSMRIRCRPVHLARSSTLPARPSWLGRPYLLSSVRTRKDSKEQACIGSHDQKEDRGGGG